jgi:hypothetical protein
MTTLTIDEVLEMARASGFMPAHDNRVQRFAELVWAKAAEREREACVKFFDDNDTAMFWGSQVATHIRARRGEA